MFREKESPKHQRLIEKDLEDVLSVLSSHQPDTEEYSKLLTTAERLHKMLDYQSPSPVSRDVVATIAANLLGILLIIKHEDVNVITSKALGFVIKIR